MKNNRVPNIIKMHRRKSGTLKLFQLPIMCVLLSLGQKLFNYYSVMLMTSAGGCIYNKYETL